jgi:hypothetical protein
MKWAARYDGTRPIVAIHRIAIQQRWLIAPLANRIHGAPHQERRPGNVLQLLHAAVLVDNGMEHHHARNMGSPGNIRVDRLDLMDDLGRLHLSTHANRLDRSFGRGWRSRARSSAAYYSRQDSTRIAAGYSSLDAV